jgi:CHASE3 domain sensor protein
MWTFLFSFLFLRRLGLSKPIRYVLAVFMIGLIIVVLIYTASLFLTLEERTSARHVDTHHAH